MKNYISHHIRFRAERRVFEKYSAQFSGKTYVLAAIELFNANTDQIGKLLSSLARPRKTFTRPQIDAVSILRRSLFSIADLGVLMGASRKDTSQIDLFMEIKKGSWNFSIWNLHQAALQACAQIAEYPVEAVKNGITPEILQAFEQQTEDFGKLLDVTDAQLKGRKAERLELRSLFKANTALLKQQIEPVIRYEAATTPGLIREYLIARKTGARKKQKSDTDLLAEISGTVTNIITGQPIANATVDIAGREMITTTDADGYYQFDEVPVGDSTLSCHITGFRLSEKITVKPAEGECLQVDFSLQPDDRLPSPA